MRFLSCAVVSVVIVFWFASPALAGNWGENWGTMIWGSVAAVPSLEVVGVWLLVSAMIAAAGWRLRHRSLQASLMLLLIPFVPLLMGPHYTNWNGFSNGEVADATKVNENFVLAAEALDDFEVRVGTLEANALPATSGASGVNLSNHLDVSGNLTSSGSEGGIITANRGAGTIVVDPTDVTSGYTATLSLDDQGIKLGHNSSVRDIQFQTEGTTRMTVSAGGNLVVEGEIFSDGINLTSVVIDLVGGGSCGDLYPVPADACPFGNSAESLSIYSNLPSCNNAPPSSYCEADGECQTNDDLDNCGPCPVGASCVDLYYRIR